MQQIERRYPYWLAGGGLIVLALLLQPGLAALSADGRLQPATLLTVTFLRIFLLGLGGAALLWPRLNDRRARMPLVALLILLTVASRGIRLDAAYLDHHSHRQTDMATLARNFYEVNPNILYPQVNWRADAPNYIESTFPLLPWLTGLGYRIAGEQPWVGRGLVALFAALEVVAIFGLVSLYWGQAAGFLAALFLALSPMAVYFGRVLIDDTPSMALTVAGLWGVAAWARGGRRWRLALGLLAITLALMVKIVAVYVYFPLLVVVWQRYGILQIRAFFRGVLTAVKSPGTWAILLLPLIPTAAWYAWAAGLGRQYLSFGIGGPASNETVVKWGSLAFVLSWPFIQRIAGRLIEALLTPAGVLPLAVGVALAVVCFRADTHAERDITADKKATRIRGFSRSGCQRQKPAKTSNPEWQAAIFRAGTLVFFAWVIGVLAYVAVSGTAQWIHDYYQLPIGLALAPFVGLGLAALSKWPAGRWRLAGRTVALGSLLLLAVFSARLLPEYYLDWQGWITHEAEVVQSITAPDETVVTIVWDNDPTLLYHVHRPGWVVDYLDPRAVEQVPRYLALGAAALVIQESQRPQAAYLEKLPWLMGLQLVERGEKYVIYRAP
ncbi:MAG: glycosyltransferase family 39 protein [Chloroflexi bacterium]|nr:glycosyltransferase family 39 protein [Chloroflexota bacterium]